MFSTKQVIVSILNCTWFDKAYVQAPGGIDLLVLTVVKGTNDKGSLESK